MDNNNQFLDWNDSISDDGQEFVLLPEGDYNFTITSFERGRFPGSAKLPACNKATMTCRVVTKEGTASVKFDILLAKSLEWRISAFFRCIGQKKHGEKLIMDWNKVVGSVGHAHFKQKTFTNSYGEDKTINELDRFYDYKEDYFKVEPEENPFDIPSEDDLPF